jgi:hypothetical protein
VEIVLIPEIIGAVAISFKESMLREVVLAVVVMRILLG